ncbi:hypothetical protein SAMN05443572_103367 [Myxococcus fulvus]|uniref:Uncharacterized protein n=1 Tax=Myxococcus fulvus TaxID=33 RepID=A0A511TA44_MYXFU|nr:hypothetical protein [Myxococcus fulvus]GEN10463.1 hypothetical protein MFU01_55000 [Myxococcus fulvus]SET82046.1 hypothetical protein SAMN05443572_103367 [Myxococcus fulvus]
MREAPASPRTESSGASFSIEIDGRRFHLHTDDSSRSIEVEVATGERIPLWRWGFGAHLRALDSHARLEGAGLDFDAEGFALDVLRDSGVPESCFTELAPLALWWALCGLREPSVGVLPEGWRQVGEVRARLRPWTFAERTQVLEASLVVLADGARELSLERYLRGMLDASVVECAPAVALESLDGATTAALLEAVVSVNAEFAAPEDRMLEASGKQARVLAEVTLKLCRALGWTPAQVWATPASEVDRLLTMLKLTEPPAPPPRQAPASRAMRLSDFPDAVVIQVEDD